MNVREQPQPAPPRTQPRPLTREWHAFWLAVGFLTRFPMLARIDYSRSLMNQSSVYFPLVGLLLGTVYAGAYTLLVFIFSPLVSILLALGLHLWITGAFHEDGLADSIDALGGGYTLQARLRIMKDSRIGTYGTVALVLALALKVALLLDVEAVWLALLITPCASRLTPLLLMRCMVYVTDPDKSKTNPVAEGFSSVRLIMAASFVGMVALGLSAWSGYLLVLVAVAVGLVALCWGLELRKKLGGYTGDTLGASVVFSELLLLMGLAA